MKDTHMTLEAWSVFVYGLLVFLVVASQATYAALTGAVQYGLSNRDSAQPNKGPLGFRIDRTLANLIEGSLMYLPIVMLAVHLNISNSWTHYAALATIISRSLYVPIYMFGIQKIRTVVWMFSFFAVPAMVYGILLGTGA
jgi:uncharacterized MAPEG superfamily protein